MPRWSLVSDIRDPRKLLIVLHDTCHKYQDEKHAYRTAQVMGRRSYKDNLPGNVFRRRCFKDSLLKMVFWRQSSEDGVLKTGRQGLVNEADGFFCSGIRWRERALRDNIQGEGSGNLRETGKNFILVHFNVVHSTEEAWMSVAHIQPWPHQVNLKVDTRLTAATTLSKGPHIYTTGLCTDTVLKQTNELCF